MRVACKYLIAKDCLRASAAAAFTITTFAATAAAAATITISFSICRRHLCVRSVARLF